MKVGIQGGARLRLVSGRPARRIAAWAALAAAAVAVAAIAVVAAAPPPPPPASMPVEIERLTGRVVVARGPVGSNVTAIRTARGIVIVDTHLSPASMRAIRARIAAELGDARVPYVINTHGHWDHCSGNQVFPDATILAHSVVPGSLRYLRPNAMGAGWPEETALAGDRERLAATRDTGEAAVLRRRIAARELVIASLAAEYVATPPDTTFDDRKDLDFGDVTLRVTHCGPAHTVSDAFVYVPSERVLVAGDVLCTASAPCFRVGPMADAPAVLAAMDEALAGGVDFVVPGHGATMTGADLRGLRDRLARQHAATTGERSAARTLEMEIEAHGAAAARARFLGAARDTAAMGYRSEDEFHILGNRYVEKSDLESSALVYEVAAGLLPGSSLIQGGLGRVSLFRGDTLRAVAAYQRAYDLAPQNRQAESMLRRLQAR